LKFKVAARGKLDKVKAGLETDAVFLLVPRIRRLGVGVFWIRKKSITMTVCTQNYSYILVGLQIIRLLGFSVVDGKSMK
jgi:hypothetical protein